MPNPIDKHVLTLIIISMRYDSLRKTERNGNIVACYERNPSFSLKEIGELFGITGGRVRAILKRYYELQYSASHPTHRPTERGD